MRTILLLVSFACAAHAASYCVTVAGLGGLPEYEKEFTRLAKELESDLTAAGPDVHAVTLSGPSATKAAIQETLSRVARQVTPEDTFSLFLIGHGTFDGETYKFNIPGPDITAQEIAALLNSVSARKQLVVDTSSSSGAAFPLLAAKGRIVITATKSGNEKNATVFGRYWVEALSDPAADANKNGIVTALEAYTLASRKTKAYFDAEKLIPTEHSMITPVTEKSVVAAVYPVRQSKPQTASANTTASLRAQQLEARVEQLKSKKSAMKPAAYKQELTALLVELARADLEVNP